MAREFGAGGVDGGVCLENDTFLVIVVRPGILRILRKSMASLNRKCGYAQVLGADGMARKAQVVFDALR